MCIKVSLIVAIYNVEKYLRECIDSLVNQTYKNLEIILVDDGAKDSCPEICDEYKKQDSRIVVIHKPNGGLVSARKAGIKIATGDYVLNVDGDDFIEPDMIEQMLKKAIENDADVVISGYKSHSEKQVIKLGNYAESGIYTGEKLNELKCKLFYSGNFYEGQVIPAVWNKLMKHSLLLLLQLSVPEKIKMGEDIAVTFPAITKSNCVVIDNEFCPYHYRLVENSMSRKNDEIYFERVAILFSYLDSIFTEVKTIKSLKYYKLFMLYVGCNSFLFSKGVTGLLSQNFKLAKIMGKLDLKEMVSDINYSTFSREQICFINSLKRKDFCSYIICRLEISLINKLFRKSK